MIADQSRWLAGLLQITSPFVYPYRVASWLGTVIADSKQLRFPLPRNPLRLQAGRDSLLGAWRGGWGGASSADQVVEVDDRSSDQAANHKDQLSGEGGEQEDELHQRIEEVEAGGGKDPRQPKERSHQTSYPEHTKSMGCLRAS